jgi:hypothetical protein
VVTIFEEFSLQIPKIFTFYNQIQNQFWSSHCVTLSNQLSYDLVDPFPYSCLIFSLLSPVSLQKGGGTDILNSSDRKKEFEIISHLTLEISLFLFHAVLLSEKLHTSSSSTTTSPTRNTPCHSPPQLLSPFISFPHFSSPPIPNNEIFCVYFSLSGFSLLMCALNNDKTNFEQNVKLQYHFLLSLFFFFYFFLFFYISFVLFLIYFLILNF